VQFRRPGSKALVSGKILFVSDYFAKNTMAALQRIAVSSAFAAIRRTPSILAGARRNYAESAAPAGDGLHLSLVLPHEVCSSRVWPECLLKS